MMAYPMKNVLLSLVWRWLMVFIAMAGWARAEPVQVEFTGPSTIYQWPLTQWDPALPADWSGYNFLVLEFRASSSQRFELAVFTNSGMITKRIHPLAGAWVRAAIPLRFYTDPPGNGTDLAATMNQPRGSYWINIESGGHGPLNKVEALGVVMYEPVGNPTLEIRSVQLAKDDPGDEVFEPKPLVDEFGQYIPAEWPGKAKTLEDLQKAWAAEDAALPENMSANVDKYGGFKDTQAKATGFFRVEQIDGRWWLVDPDGHLFFSTGVNGIGTAMATRVTQERKDLFTILPPALGGRGGLAGYGGSTGSFYTWNLLRRYGTDWPEKWVDFTARRMNAWGLNTVGSGAAGLLSAQRVPVMVMLRWQLGPAIMNMPDVYAPDFAAKVDEAANAQCMPGKDNPWIVGYYIGNEPPWPGRESQLVDLILAGPETELQKKLKAWLTSGDMPERRKSFIYDAFEHYLETVVAAVRKYDPNHLILGIRFGGKPPDEVIKLARLFDVYSHNIYEYAPDQAYLNKIEELTGRPILIGEFHIGAPGRGMAPGLVQAADQEQRGVAYRYYVENAAANPAVVGTHWFEWIDEPATGRSDGENYNIGFVDVTDRPYVEMAAAAKTTFDRLLAVHSGKEPPVTQKAKAQ
jgi:hypothetical protein